MRAALALLLWSLLALSYCSVTTTRASAVSPTTRITKTTKSTTTSSSTTCAPPPSSTTGSSCKDVLCTSKKVSYDGRDFNQVFAGCNYYYEPGSFNLKDTITYEFDGPDCDAVQSCADYAVSYGQQDFVTFRTFDTTICKYVWTCQAGKLSPFARYKQDKNYPRFYAYRGTPGQTTSSMALPPTTSYAFN